MARPEDREGGRTTPKGPKGPSPLRPKDPPHDHDESRMVSDARAALEEDSPFRLMCQASTLIDLFNRRPGIESVEPGMRDVSDGDVFETFVSSGHRETAALALAVAVMHPDEFVAARIRARLKDRIIPNAPVWLESLGRIVVTDALVQADPFGDGELVVMSWRWPAGSTTDGSAASALVHVGHTLGTVVKTAMVVPEPMADLREMWAQAEGLRTTHQVIGSADARSRIIDAIANGDARHWESETDTWPSCRAMIEWMVRQAPSGGTGYLRPPWSVPDRDDLLDAFVASPFAAEIGIDPGLVEDLAEPLIWFGCDYGVGDPLRWSPDSVCLVLASWYRQMVIGLEPEDLEHLPDVLAAFVRFTHARRRVQPELTAETLDAVERGRQDFLRVQTDGEPSAQ